MLNVCKKRMVLVFILAEMIFTILVQIIGGYTNIIVSFLSIVLAFLFSFINASKNMNTKLLSLGLFFTVCADVFLVVLYPKNENIGMVFFCITQILYFLIIYFNQNENIKNIHLIIRSGCSLIMIIFCFIILKSKTNFLSVISVCYYVNLLVNIVFSFFMKKKMVLFSLGLILFSLCDIFIGFAVMNQMFFDFKNDSLFYFLANPKFNVAWLFYIPSQTLISISGFEFN